MNDVRPVQAAPGHHKVSEGQLGEAYRALVDHSLQGLVIFQDGRAVFANQAMAEITGYSVDEILAMSAEQIRNFVHPEDRELVWTRYRKRLSGGSPPQRYEIRGLRKDGGICWLEIHASRFEYGGRPAIHAAYMDITARKRAEEALRCSEERYRAIFDNAILGIYRTTPDGKILAANPALIRMLGYDSFEALAQRNLETEGFEPGYSRSFFKERLESEDQVTGIESSWMKRDGTVLYVRENVKAIRDGQGRIQYYEGTVEDITKCRKAEWELEEAHHFLLTVLNSVPGGVVVLDRDGTIVMMNDFWRVSGGANGPARKSIDTGSRYLDAWRAATGSDAEDAWRMAKVVDALLSGQSDRFQMDYRRHNPDQECWYHLRAHGFSYRDKRWAVLVHMDITDRKQVEHRLLAYRERLRTLAAKLSLTQEHEKRRVGLGLHEKIGQGLVMVKLSLQSLRETVDRNTAEALARSCGDIDVLTEQICSLSFELTNSVLHEVGLVEAVDAYLEQEIQRKHKIVCKCQASGDFSTLDTEMKMALFCNLRELLDSLAKHADAKHIWVRLKRSSRTVAIAVRHDGGGIEWRKLNNPGASGGYLGLFNIREQIEALGGTLSISLSNRSGACITIVAPVQCRANLRS